MLYCAYIDIYYISQLDETNTSVCTYVYISNDVTWKDEKISEIKFGVNLPPQMFQYAVRNLHKNANKHLRR